MRGDEPTLVDIVGDFADHAECQEETTEPEFIELEGHFTHWRRRTRFFRTKGFI